MSTTRLSRSVILVAALIGLACQREHPTAPGMGAKPEAAPPLDPNDYITIHHNLALSPGWRPSALDARPAPQANNQPAPPPSKDFHFPVAVVLMPKLPIADASAVVLSRPQPFPQHIIMMSQDSLTLGALAAAMRALTLEVKKANTDQPTSLQVLKVKGQVEPALWKRMEVYRDMAQWELDTLPKLPRRMVAGVGAYPAMLILMGVQRGAGSQ